MKKFISLVLALVMALSLTTMAWGATHPTTATDAAGLQAAIASAGDGDTIELQNAVNLGSTALNVNKKIILDLNGKTITGEVEINTTAPVTIKNGYITNNVANGRCIDTRVGVDLYVENVVLTSTGNTNTQPLTIGGPGATAGKVYLKGCTIDARTAGYAIINFTPVTLTIEDCDLYGYAAIYMKDGSNGSVVTIKNGSTLTGYGHAGATNAFGTIVFETDGIEVNIENGSTIDNEGDTTQQKLFEINDNTDNIVTVPAEYADDLVEEGYVVTANSDGSVSIAGISASAPAGGTALPTLYDMVTTDAAQTKTVMVTVTTYAAKNPTYDTDGISIADGNVAYVVFSNLPGKTFVQVNTQGQADYTVYKAGTTTLFGYFDEIVNPFYRGNGEAFYNFGKACGQYKDANFNATATYYTFEGDVYKAVSALEANAGNLMVNNTLVPVSTTSGAWVGHTVAYTYDKDFKVTAVTCSACGAVATIVPNYMSLPEQAIVDGTYGGPINTTMYYYWTNAVVKPVTPTTPSTDKVTSAETFDAGIAMYVGMSVMAAAGSAVVIGKKKD